MADLFLMGNVCLSQAEIEAFVARPGIGPGFGDVRDNGANYPCPLMPAQLILRLDLAVDIA